MPWAELTDSTLYYELAGDGDPVLLIPGLGATSRSWDPIVPELGEKFSLILPDNRDVGRSKGKRKPHCLSDFAADLLELLDLLQVQRAHVVGISLGGVIAQTLAVEHPSRVNRLILISTAHRFGPYLRDISMLLGQSLYRLPYAMFQRTIELLGTAPAYYDTHADTIEERLRIARENRSPRSAVVRQLRCLAVSEVDEPYYRILSPTLILAGEYDAMIPNCYGKRMADVIPGSEFHVLPGCGHNAVEEMPQVVRPMIEEFLLRKEDARRREKISGESLSGRSSFDEKSLDPTYDWSDEQMMASGSHRKH
jgi:pimeloyl-ACP methyl ester carboxylesterase